MLFVGDSICEAQCEWHDPVYARTIGWAGRILQSYGMSGLNAAKSGASVSDCRGSNTVYQQLARFARTDYDFVILARRRKRRLGQRRSRDDVRRL